MSAAVFIAWQHYESVSIARCGGNGQGRMSVMPAGAGGWRWFLDMLPADPEPVIAGEADSREAAIAAAEKQAEHFPALIGGARRVA